MSFNSTTRRHLLFPLAASAFSFCWTALVLSNEESAGPKRLLVVAPPEVHDALADFIRHKQRLRPTEIVSLKDALTGAGGDDPERLKRYLFAAWRERNVGYVLLVGDADVMPVRYMVLDRVTKPAYDYAFYPSDLYYADLAGPDGQFDDWNAAKDGFHADYFGEVRGEKNKGDAINFDRVDYRPDIAVGRWPVSTPEEVRRAATKSIAYEKGVLESNAPGMRRAAFIAAGGWVDARGLFDRIATSLPSGWSVEKRYFSGSGRNDGTPPPDEAHVLELLNDGVGLIVHAGHGEGNKWVGSLNLKRIDRVKNADRLPVAFSVGCDTARFAACPPYEGYTDASGKEHRGTNAGEVFTAPPPPPAPYQKGTHNPTGLGEGLLRHGDSGAVAYIGCNTGSQPCALTLLEGFVKALGAAAEPSLGDCWASAVSYYYDKERLASLTPKADWYPPSIFFQGMKFMLFGDPSLRMPGAVAGK